MAIAWRRRSPERSPAGPRPRRCSGGSLAKHRASWLAPVLFMLALSGVSEATVDLTGDWYEAVYFSSDISLTHFVQTGTSLQIGGIQATIDPSTGSFHSEGLFFCPPYSLCPCVFRAQASMDGNSFAGNFYTYGPPPDCTSPTCACRVEFSIGSYYGSRSPCGNGIVDPGEACDDGSLGRTGGCCSLGCTQPAGSGQVCTQDRAPCTNDICNGTGTCIHPVGPAGTCRTAQRSLLLVKNKSDVTKNRLIWKWTVGAQTSQVEFANPTGTADYALCIFAGTASALVDEVVIPASASKWSALGTKGYKYKDPAATADGINRVILKGSTQDKSKALVKGQGSSLPDLPLGSITAPVTVQLVNSDNGLCWGASYEASQLLKNDTGRIKAKAP